MKKILAADLFCGAGGASVGLRRACTRLGLPLELLAINHWPIAVKTHTAVVMAEELLKAGVQVVVLPPLPQPGTED